MEHLSMNSVVWSFPTGRCTLFWMNYCLCWFSIVSIISLKVGLWFISLVTWPT
jgi:hypothetical protein